MSGALGSRTAVRGPSRAQATPQASALSNIPVSVITLIAAIGVLVSCLAYAAGRQGYGSSGTDSALYWAGQVLILLPISGRLLSRRHLSNSGAITLVVVLT